jgi:hypothetical protein
LVLAKITEDRITPGVRSALLDTLKIMDIRCNIIRKVGQYTTDWGNAGLSVDTVVINVGGDMGGDIQIFTDIKNSTIVNRAVVQEAFNKISKVDEGAAQVLSQIAKMVDNSGNASIGLLFNEFSNEIKKDARDESKLKQHWDSLVKLLPDIASIGKDLAKLTSLFL